MADEHILLPRDRYQRLLNITNGSIDVHKRRKIDMKGKSDKIRQDDAMARKVTLIPTKTENGKKAKVKKIGTDKDILVKNEGKSTMQREEKKSTRMESMESLVKSPEKPPVKSTVNPLKLSVKQKGPPGIPALSDFKNWIRF